MKLNSFLLTGFLATMLLPACVSTKKYQTLQTDYAALQSRTDAYAKEGSELRANLSAANVRIENLEARLRAEQEHLKTLQSALDKCLTSAGQGNVNISK